MSGSPADAPKKRGRKAMRPEDRASIVMTFRVTAEERANLDEVAELTGERVSEFVRQAITTRMKKEKRRHGR